MSYKISKELFEAVYNEDLLRIEIGTYSVVAYLTDGTEFTENIDTFFFDCKEWLLSKEYDIWSGYHENEYFCYVKTKNTFISNSEQQAVFDATDYVRRLTEGK